MGGESGRGFAQSGVGMGVKTNDSLRSSERSSIVNIHSEYSRNIVSWKLFYRLWAKYTVVSKVPPFTFARSGIRTRLFHW